MSIALHLSRNETKHIYMESPTEGMIQTFKAMKAENLDCKDVKPIPMAKGASAKQRELLMQDYVWQMMEYFNSSETHYFQSEVMNFNRFYNSLMGSSGGVGSFPRNPSMYG